MSLTHKGRWHYEHIPSRGPGHEWRVGDEDDDYIIDFKTEEQARKFVRDHNKTINDLPDGWML